MGGESRAHQLGIAPARHLQANAWRLLALFGTGQVTAPPARVARKLEEVAEQAGIAAHALHQAQHVVVRTIVDIHGHTLRLRQPGPARVEDGHVSATEAVDRLLCVAYGRQVARPFAREERDQSQLPLVGILELVDHHQTEAPVEGMRNLGMTLNGLEGAGDQIVVVEVRALELELPVALVHAPGEADDLRAEPLDALVLGAEYRLRKLSLGVLLEGLQVRLAQVGYLDLRKCFARARRRALAWRQDGKGRERGKRRLRHVALFGGDVERGDGLEHVHQRDNLGLRLVRLGADEARKALRALRGLAAQHPDHAHYRARARGPQRVLGAKVGVCLVALDLAHHLIERTGHQGIGHAAVAHLELGVDPQLEGIAVQDA